ncbi:MAG: fasciclin domain-containing protein [Gammaproteobacteria bacterium]|nr:fasciclin domain-containing protein [Gammaproteobacteria bacterium]
MYWRHDKHKRYEKSYQSDSRAKESKSGAEDLGAAPTGTIVETAISAGNFNTLISAIESAGLVETLNQTGPFTVFAPSDEAFEKVPESIRSAIIADKDALAELLSYHVVSGEVTAADVAKLDTATTVQGSSVTFDTSDGVKVNGAKVVAADIRATNGIIHVIDTVMVPN